MANAGEPRLTDEGATPHTDDPREGDDGQIAGDGELRVEDAAEGIYPGERFAPSPYEAHDPYPYDDSPEEEPGWVRRAVHSLAYYLVVMGGLAGGAWWLAVQQKTPFFTWFAGSVSFFAGLVILLRVLRGSLLEARKRTRRRLQEDADIGITPSNRLSEKLYRNEKVLWESRQHPLSILVMSFSRIGRLLGWFDKKRKWRRRFAIAVTVGMLVLWAMLFSKNETAGIGLGIALVVAFIAYNIGEWSVDRYALTDQRFMAVIGLFSTDVPFMPRARVTDVKVSTSVMSKFLGWLRFIDPYGMYEIESAGQDQALRDIAMIPQADVVAAALELGKVP